jgi:hypothetical protein
LANRGIWESGWWLGHTVPMAHTESDIDTYLELIVEFVTTATT